MTRELSLAETGKRLAEKAVAYASVYGIQPSQAELDALFRLHCPAGWRSWLDRRGEDQTPLLRCWLTAIRRLRDGGQPADGDPLLLALRVLAKIEELALSTAAALTAMAGRDAAGDTDKSQ